MFSRRQLHELLYHESATPEVLSVYLEPGVSSGAAGAFRSVLNASLGRESRLRQMQGLLERVERHLSGELGLAGHRGLALFASERGGLWQSVALPEPVHGCLRVDSRPYLAPLFPVLDQYQRFGIALVSPARTRCLEIYLGAVQELEPVPGPGEPAHALPQERLHRYLQEITEKTALHSRQRDWDRVVFSLPDGWEAPLSGHLHERLQRNLILDPSLEPGSPSEGILAAIRAHEIEARKVRESVWVHRLLDATRVQGLGVLGLERTLEALERGQVRRLLIQEGFAKMGRVCPVCGEVSLAARKCPSCPRLTEPVLNLAGDLVRAALESGAEVARVLYDTGLDSLGRIGAELSHRSGAEVRPAPRPASDGCLAG